MRRVEELWPTFVTIDELSLDDAIDGRLVDLAIRIVSETIIESPRPSSSSFYPRKKFNMFEKYNDRDLAALGLAVANAARAYMHDCYGDETGYRIDLSGWPLVYKDQDTTLMHHHIGSHLSALYYPRVDPISAEARLAESGQLVLFDPRPINRDFMPSGHSKYKFIEVVQGMLVMFPGYLMHEVPTYMSPGLRVVYAMNIDVHREGVEEPPVDSKTLVNRGTN